jgi:hypothetical protein
MAETRYRKGDLVKFRVGVRSVQGVVKEDRGPIGIKGRRLYLVEFRLGKHSESLSEIELPAEEFQLVQNTVTME